MIEIELTRGMKALVDDDDFDRISELNWQCSSKGYALTKVRIDGRRVPYLMHRFIMNFPDKEIDHINNNKLDNRKENLRLCDRNENCQNASKYKNNTSGYKGVDFNKKTGKFRTRIQHNKKSIEIGLFNTAKEAAIAYNKAAVLYHKEFANLNIIEGT